MNHQSPENSASEKQSFDVYIANVPKDKLKSKICILVGQEEYSISPEFQWIVTECIQCSTGLQAQDLGTCLGLASNDVDRVIHNAPREREDQLAGTIRMWSKTKHDNATIEGFLEALYSGDRTELIETICNSIIKLCASHYSYQ